MLSQVSLLSVNRIPSLIGSADSHQITAFDDGVMKQDGANVQFMKEEGRAVNIFKDEIVIQFLNQLLLLQQLTCMTGVGRNIKTCTPTLYVN
ncbi:hypothetical protein Tco_0509449 [Tanacetum coccineum]